MTPDRSIDPSPEGHPASEMRRGGRVLVGSILGIGAGVSALLLYTNGLFFAGLAQDFGLTRTAFGFGILLVTIALATANPFVGFAVDRFGARPMAAAGLIALALGFAAMATAVHSIHSYLFIQTLVAFAAASSGPITYTKLVSGWFARRRGLALGLTLTGIGFAAALAPPLVARAIAGNGWQAGYWLLAGIATTGLLPVLLLLRDPPPAPVAAAADRASAPLIEQPFRSRAFWTMMLAFFTMALAFAGLLPHFVPLLLDAGVAPVRAGGLAGLIGIAVIGSRVIIGLLVDRFFAPWVAIGVCIVAMLGCATLLVFGASGAIVGALALGVAMGGEVDLISFLVARYFGTARFGRVYGGQYSVFILGSGLGPLWIGALYDHSGSYASALITAIAGLALASLLLLLLPRYPTMRQMERTDTLPPVDRIG